jgi:hypothetical protein
MQIYTAKKKERKKEKKTEWSIWHISRFSFKISRQETPLQHSINATKQPLDVHRSSLEPDALFFVGFKTKSG